MDNGVLSSRLVARTDGTLQEQVRRILTGRIKAGEYAPGDRLPTERELADEFGISLAPLRGAMDQLATIGMVDRIRGRGTYVNDHPIPYRIENWTSSTSELRRMGVKFSTKVLACGLAPVEDLRVRSHLQLVDNDAYRVERLISIEGRPGIYMNSWMPADLTANMPDQTYFREGGSLYAHLQSEGIELLFAKISTGVHLLHDEEAELLESQFGAATLEIEGLAFGANGPVEFSRLLYGNHNFRITSTQSVRF